MWGWSRWRTSAWVSWESRESRLLWLLTFPFSNSSIFPNWFCGTGVWLIRTRQWWRSSSYTGVSSFPSYSASSPWSFTLSPFPSTTDISCLAIPLYTPCCQFSVSFSMKMSRCRKWSSSPNYIRVCRRAVSSIWRLSWYGFGKVYTREQWSCFWLSGYLRKVLRLWWPSLSQRSSFRNCSTSIPHWQIWTVLSFWAKSSPCLSISFLSFSWGSR